MCYNYKAHSGFHLAHIWMKMVQSVKFQGVNGKSAHFTPHNDLWCPQQHMSIVLKCMTIMSIIITEEDLCKKHAKKCAKIYQFSSLPSKWIQAVNDPNTKIDSKPHICAYNYNTRTGFRDHKKTWGPRVLSSALVQSIRHLLSEFNSKVKCLRVYFKVFNYGLLHFFGWGIFVICLFYWFYWLICTINCNN